MIILAGLMETCSRMFIVVLLGRVRNGSNLNINRRMTNGLKVLSKLQVRKNGEEAYVLTQESIEFKKQGVECIYNMMLLKEKNTHDF